jgi:hypothetical protein
MSEAKADANERGATGRERAKHVRPGESDLVVVTTAQLSELVERACQRAISAGTAPLLVDKQQLARQLGCSAAHIDNLRKQGLPSLALGQAVRFEPARVLEWLRSHESANDSEVE